MNNKKFGNEYEVTVKCVWNLSTVLDCVVWFSDCGLDWQFSNPETPADNEMVYCPKCGRKLEVQE